MYELIEIATGKQIGIFGTCADALKWITEKGTGNKSDYRIFPW